MMYDDASPTMQCAPHPWTFAGAALVFTCEHGGNQIPAPYRALFAPHRALLNTHRGFDAGALIMARALAAAFGAPLLWATVSRLLVDLNRSVGHPQLHFQPVLELPGPHRLQILKRHYQPYRSQVERLIAQAIATSARVIHISCHSFTPELHGKPRSADIGLLYDPARPGERALCARWKHRLSMRAPELGVRRNYPYDGRNDGLTTWLRKHHAPDAYVGIELELNQKHTLRSTGQWAALREVVIESLRAALTAHDELAVTPKPGQPKRSSRYTELPCVVSESMRRKTGVHT